MARESNGRDRWLTVEEEGRVLAACGPWLRDMVQFLPWGLSFRAVMLYPQTLTSLLSHGVILQR